MLQEQTAKLREIVAGAQLNQLDTMLQASYRSWAEGSISDDDATEFRAVVEARRAELKGKLAVEPRLAGAAAAKVILTGTMGRRSRVGARPISSESVARRRRVCASGWMPPGLAERFTQGERAALSIIACEIASRGLCRFTLARISAAAGVSRSTAKRAVRQAQALGLLTSKEWRLERYRSAPNTVTIESPEWLAWLRMRSRSAEDRKGGGVQKGTGYKLHNYQHTGTLVDAPRARGTFREKMVRSEPFLTAEMLNGGARRSRGKAEPYTARRNPHLAALDSYFGSQNG